MDFGYCRRYNFLMPKSYTVTTAAEFLDRLPNSVRRAVERGTLPARKVGSVWIIEEADLIHYRDHPPKPGRKTAEKPPEPPPEPPPLRVEIDPRSRLAIKDKRTRPKDDKGREGEIEY